MRAKISFLLRNYAMLGHTYLDLMVSGLVGNKPQNEAAFPTQLQAVVTCRLPR